MSSKWLTPKRQYRAMTLEGMREIKEAYEILRSQDDPTEKVWHAHMLLETRLANMQGYVEGRKDWDCL